MRVTMRTLRRVIIFQLDIRDADLITPLLNDRGCDKAFGLTPDLILGQFS